MSLEYRLLGPLDALVEGLPAQLGPPRQRVLLAALLCEANALVPTARLVDQLWPTDPPSSAENLVQGYVSGLRKVLGKEAIETRGTGYVARVAQNALDLQVFERLAHEGSVALENGQSEAAAAVLAEALGLWRGPALSDLGREPFVVATAARLEELRLLALERRLAADIAIGHHADVIGEIETVAAEHPLRERTWGLLMMALYRSGRQAEALDAYRRARATLVEEIGIEPGAGLRELEAAMLRQDRSLDIAPRAEPESLQLRSILVAALAADAVGGSRGPRATACPATRARAGRRHDGRFGRGAGPGRRDTERPARPWRH